MNQAKTEQPGANAEVRIGATVVAPSGSPSISSAADSLTFDAMLAWLASGEGILTALAFMAAIGLAGFSVPAHTVAIAVSAPDAGGDARWRLWSARELKSSTMYRT